MVVPIHHVVEGLAEQGHEALLCLDEAHDVRPKTVRRQRVGVAEERVVLTRLDQDGAGVRPAVYPAAAVAGLDHVHPHEGSGTLR